MTTNSHQNPIDDGNTNSISSTGIPTGSPVASSNAPHNHDEEQQRQGRSCFGCCCDMRRAVIILSALGIVISSLSYVGNLFFLFEPAKEDATEISDIDRIDTLNIINVAMTSLAVLFYTLAIVGAIRFNNRLVLINAVYAIINFMTTAALFTRASDDIDSFDLVYVNMIGGPAIGTAMTVYVNMTFYREVTNSTMSEK
jgi:hypothetical protein